MTKNRSAWGIAVYLLLVPGWACMVGIFLADSLLVRTFFLGSQFAFLIAYAVCAVAIELYNHDRGE